MDDNKYLVTDVVANNDSLSNIAKFLQSDKTIMCCDNDIYVNQIDKSKYRLFDRFDIFSYALNNPGFRCRYDYCDYKFFVPILQFSEGIYKETIGDDVIQLPYCNFDILYSSDMRGNGYSVKYNTRAIDLYNLEFDKIKFIYVVYSDNTFNYAVVLSKSDDVSMIDVVRTALCRSFDLNQYLSDKGFDTTGYTDYDKYNIVQVPFNRSQPVVKGSFDGECIVKNPDDTTDAVFKVCSVYRREIYA